MRSLAGIMKNAYLHMGSAWVVVAAARKTKTAAIGGTHRMTDPDLMQGQLRHLFQLVVAGRHLSLMVMFDDRTRAARLER